MEPQRDRPDSNTGVPQIEVTPEMVEAGVSLYLDYCPDSGSGDRTDRKMIAEIFSAMMAVRCQARST
jgi:hypothetical protein